MCLHHLGKSPRPGAAGLIGSTAIEGNSDTNIIMNCDDEGRRTLLTSQRYGERLPETLLNFDKARGLMSLGDKKFVAEKNNLAERIIEVLKENGAMRRDELQDEVKGNAKKDAMVLDKRLIQTGVKNSRKDPVKLAWNADWVPGPSYDAKPEVVLSAF
jgi:hypothetical protein